MNIRLKAINTIFFVVFGMVLLYISFKGINLSLFIETIKNSPIHWIIVSMFFGYLAYFFRALRWLLLIKSANYSTNSAQLVHSIAFGYLCNTFIPRSGEVFRCTALNKATKIPVSILFGHVILERLIDVVILLLCILVSLILNYNSILLFSKTFHLPSNLIVFGCGFVLLIYVIFLNKKNIFSEVNLTKIEGFIKGIKNGFRSIKNVEKKLHFIIYTILIWLCYLLMTMVCFWCFSETLNFSFSEGLFVLVAGGLGMMVPTPSGIGSYHYLVIAALGVLGVNQITSQYFAITMHGAQSIMVLLSGIIGMVSLYFTANE